MKKETLKTLVVLLILCAVIAATCYYRAHPKEKVITPEDNSEFVNLTDAVPDAILEIRYFGTYNFVGARIDGYKAPVALLTGCGRHADEALLLSRLGQVGALRSGLYCRKERTHPRLHR